MLASAPRQSLQLTPQLQLRHQEWEQPQIQIRLSFRVGHLSMHPSQIRLLMHYLQSRFPPLWRPQIHQFPDWLIFVFKGLPEQGAALQEQAFSLFQALSTIPLAVLERLHSGLHIDNSSLEAYLIKQLILLAFPEHEFPGVPPLNAETPKRLEKLWQQVLKQALAYIELSEPQPLLQSLQNLRLPQFTPESVLHPPPVLAPHAPGFLKHTLELNLQGAWIYWGFRMPGLEHPHWLHGYLLKFWLEDLCSQGILKPESLTLHMQAYQQYSLLYGRFYVPRTHEVEQVKYSFLTDLKQALASHLNPTSLQFALQRCQHLYHRGIANLHPGHPLQLSELCHQEGYIQQRLQLLKFSAMQKTVQTYLHRDNIVILDCLSPHIRKQRAPEQSQILDAPRYQPTAPKPKPQLTWLTEPQTLSLKPGSNVLLYPCRGADYLCLGARLSSGSAQDRVAGTTALLMTLLAQELNQLASQKGLPGNCVKTRVNRDSAWFFLYISAAQLPKALPILAEISQLPRFGREALETARQQLIAIYQSAQLKVYAQAERAFYQTGFNNHPYARPVEGDYHALLQITPEDLELRLHELLNPLQFHPQVVGAIPEHISDSIQETWQNLTLYHAQPRTQGVREIHPRRGEIQVDNLIKSTQRLQGQIFAQPLTPPEISVVLLLTTWLQDRLYQTQGHQSRVDLALLQQAWLYTLMAPTPQNLQYWWHPLLKIQDKSLSSYQYQAATALRSRLLEPLSCWETLSRWLSNGYPLSALQSLDSHIIQLTSEPVQQFLQETLALDNHWLQIVFKGS